MVESRLQLVTRVASSSTFAKSERLRALFVHLCKLSLSGRTEDLCEQKIGQQVFGRDAHYDSGNDGIVRTQASRLRQRLVAHFDSEGEHEPVRIVLPRGSYVPVFEPNIPDAKISVDHGSRSEIPIEVPISVQSLQNTLWPSRRLIGTFVTLSVLIIAVMVGIHYVNQGSPRRGDQPLWDAMFPKDGHTLFIPGDSSLVTWEWAMNRDLDLPAYIEGGYRKLQASPSPQESQAVALANRRYTSVVDAEIAENVGAISGRRGAFVDFRYARDMRPNDLKGRNVILIGSAEANPWLRLYEPNLNFVFSVDRTNMMYSVLNREPRAGEPTHWNIQSGIGHDHADALVAYLANAGGGNILMLEGTDMAGTECAWEFVSDKQALLPILDQIRRTDGSIRHFEVVLAARNVNGNAVQSSIVAYRIHP